MWIPLGTDEELKEFIEATNDLHDASFVAAQLSTRPDPSFGGARLIPDVDLGFQVDIEPHQSVTLRCQDVRELAFRQTADDCDTIVDHVEVRTDNDEVAISIWLIGLPLKGEPNSYVMGDTDRMPDGLIRARAVAWRLGNTPSGAGA